MEIVTATPDHNDLSIDSRIHTLVTGLSIGEKPIPLARSLLTAYYDDANIAFQSNGTAGHLVTKRSHFIDELLSALWTHFLNTFEGLALVAVGGYGRGELHPHSDIDILILADSNDIFQKHEDGLSQFVTLLWDLKLDVGHSVRTIEECVQEARNDLTIITNLIESRLICGDRNTLNHLHRQLNESQIWPPAQFFSAKFDEVTARHNKHNSPDYNLEPNVKNSPGTLRDIQTVSWVANRFFKDGRFEVLYEKNILTQYEFERLIESRSFLWNVRYALHMISGREEDRLLFDLQPQVAEQLGFRDHDEKLAVETFMATFYRHQATITEMCDLLLMHFESLKLSNRDELTNTVINEHFEINNGYLHLTSPTLFKDKPYWLLKVFNIMAQHPSVQGMTASTIRALIENRHLIDDDFRNNSYHNSLFIELLRNRSCVVRELTRMMRYSILGRYIPEFGKIIGFMEYDLFHKYTVDEHCLRMIRLLRHFRFGDVREQFPIASRIIHKIHKKELLYLAALLHDTGKSEAGDHTINGEKITREFCSRHGLSEYDTDMVSWLVENHLLMSQASQRVDINDPDEVHQFAQDVGDLYHLDMLFLISVTDIYSTNPDLWTPWRAEQMRELYRNTQRALRRGLNNPINREDVIVDIQQSALAELAQLGLDQASCEKIWGNPGDEYFLREGVNNIIWHTLEISRHKANDAPLISIRQTSDEEFEGATQIFIFMKDQPDLFAVTTATLDQLDLNIQDARIMTSEVENNAVDTYIVLDRDNNFIEDPKRLKEIHQSLLDALSNPDQYTTIIGRRTPRILKQFHVNTQVTLSNDPFNQRTIIEVIAADRPGLLARVGKILSENKVQIQGAKILTEGERVSDLFFVVDQDGKPFADPQQCELLQEALISGLDEQIEAQTAVK